VLQLLQSHGLLAAGAGLLVALVGLQALSADPQFKRDLRGGMSLLVGYLLLRTVDLYRGEQLSEGLHRVLELAWMLALSFAVIRLSVSILLKLAMIALSSVALPYYLFRSRGFAGGAAAIARSLVVFAGTMAAYRLGAWFA
jgi:hypothetical protein